MGRGIWSRLKPYSFAVQYLYTKCRAVLNNGRVAGKPEEVARMGWPHEGRPLLLAFSGIDVLSPPALAPLAGEAVVHALRQLRYEEI
jgi:hypothetical protein